MALEDFKNSMSALVVVVLIIGGFVLALDGFQDAIEDDNPCLNGSAAFWNATAGECRNASDPSTALGSTNYQYNISQEGLQGVGNASSYLSTIGTLIGVAALIAIVVSAFMFARK